MKSSNRRYNVRAIERALRLLSLLSDGKAWRLPDLSEALGVSTSTTYRLLATLMSHNYVVHDKRAGGYHLGLSCLELAHAYHHGNDLRTNAMPELENLRDETTETVHLGVLEGMEVVYLEKLHGLHAVGLMSSRVGGRSPAYCTGLGKVMLAYCDPDTVRNHFRHEGLKTYTEATIHSAEELMNHLDQIRNQGYAIDRGEHESEVRCVAAPIFNISGENIAAVSVSGPASRMKPQIAGHDLIRRTIESAGIISSRLGYRPGLKENDL